MPCGVCPNIKKNGSGRDSLSLFAICEKNVWNAITCTRFLYLQVLTGTNAPLHNVGSVMQSCSLIQMKRIICVLYRLSLLSLSIRKSLSFMILRRLWMRIRPTWPFWCAPRPWGGMNGTLIGWTALICSSCISGDPCSRVLFSSPKILKVKIWQLFDPPREDAVGAKAIAHHAGWRSALFWRPWFPFKIHRVTLLHGHASQLHAYGLGFRGSDQGIFSSQFSVENLKDAGNFAPPSNYAVERMSAVETSEFDAWYKEERCHWF